MGTIRRLRVAQERNPNERTKPETNMLKLAILILVAALCICNANASGWKSWEKKKKWSPPKHKTWYAPKWEAPKHKEWKAKKWSPPKHKDWYAPKWEAPKHKDWYAPKWETRKWDSKKWDYKKKDCKWGYCQAACASRATPAAGVLHAACRVRLAASHTFFPRAQSLAAQTEPSVHLSVRCRA